ncbi:MAG: HypC/HybG/HupF family hydrogenase formation chaperone [Clostridiales Family XIII bacterium]|jgi:hydrogenase expression/formation protein HypC|nr:HypC/HybG/HupF family hydrogenase formation chaperone [Clostridiales Family XIII bacterium]
MCVAYPGKVLSVDSGKAVVDFNGNVVDVRVGIVDVKSGDYVLVHAGMAIEAMSEAKAKEILEVFSGMEEALS